MAGGGGGGGGGGQANSQQLQTWLQNFPSAAAGPNAATAAGAPNPQAAQPQNSMLARLAAMGQGGGQMGQSPAMGLMNQGMGLARAGQQPMPQAQLPRQTPVVQGGPPVAPGSGAGMMGGQMQGGQGVNPQMMQQLMLRGLLGGGQ
jgi:hypothetical protein